MNEAWVELDRSMTPVTPFAAVEARHLFSSSGREKGTSLNSTCLTPKPLAPSVYVHVPEAPSPHERSISVTSLFPPRPFSPPYDRRSGRGSGFQPGRLGRYQGPLTFCHPGSVSGPFRPPTGTTSWKASTNGPSSASNFVGRGW